jgi:3-hydroxybutyryl-CoA dehydratase
MTSAAREAFAALHVGKKATMRKTVGESDVYLFAGITGDLGPNHCDEDFMRKTPYKHRIAHGVLAVGFMSTCSTKVIGDLPPAAVVSYGYDKIRFPRPLYIGDTVTVTYEIVERDEKELKTFAKVTCTTDRGDTVAVGTHILKVVE